MEAQEITELDDLTVDESSYAVVLGSDASSVGKATLKTLRDTVGVTLSSVTASAVSLDVGATPTAQAVMGGTSQNPTIALTLGLPKLNEIASAEQTTISTENGGTNYFTVTLTDGTTSQIAVKNGEKGEQGSSGVVASTNYIFSLVVDPDDNHLYIYTADDQTTSPLSIDSDTGHLILDIDDGSTDTISSDTANYTQHFYNDPDDVSSGTLVSTGLAALITAMPIKSILQYQTGTSYTDYPDGYSSDYSGVMKVFKSDANTATVELLQANGNVEHGLYLSGTLTWID